jgi:peptide/nickel transport system permease protein
MGPYLLRRLLIAVPSLLGISVVLFTVLALAPGDPFEELATNPAVPPEVRTALRIKFGLDDPIALRYLRWRVAMLGGDWGFSFVSRVDVGALILQRLPTTLFVIGSSQLLAILIAMPVGIFAATRPYSMFDQMATAFAFIGFSLPTFFTGLLFILVFSIWLDWLPFVYRSDIGGSGWQWFLEYARQAIMPMKHVVRNALTPVVTLVALQMPAIFGGAIVTEQIFRVPGIGSLLISSILANDTPVVMAVTFVFACLVVLFNLIADILYGWLDPRITFG